jgi:YbgC/YbaW family acyl-CoA thioester hydrolase
VPSEYRLARRVNFYETDLAGIVHFSWFFRYMEEAEHALWRAAGLSIASAGEEIGYPRLAASCRFHAPLRFEDEFEVWIRVAEMTRRTMRYASLITRGGVRIASGSTTMACVSKRPGETMKAIDLPAQVVERFTVAPGVEEADDDDALRP